MMSHEEIKKHLFALYDGELAPENQTEIETHLSRCAECRELYQGWARIAKVFFQPPKQLGSDFFVQSVMNRIHALEISQPVKSWNLSFGWLVPAAGLALALLAVMPLPQAARGDAFLFQETDGAALSADDTLQFVMGENNEA